MAPEGLPGALLGGAVHLEGGRNCCEDERARALPDAAVGLLPQLLLRL